MCSKCLHIRHPVWLPDGQVSFCRGKWPQPSWESSLEGARVWHSPGTAPSRVLLPARPPRGRTSRSQTGLSCSPSTWLGGRLRALQMCEMQSQLLLSSGTGLSRRDRYCCCRCLRKVEKGPDDGAYYSPLSLEGAKMSRAPK